MLRAFNAFILYNEFNTKIDFRYRIIDLPEGHILPVIRENTQGLSLLKTHQVIPDSKINARKSAIKVLIVFFKTDLCPRLQSLFFKEENGSIYREMWMVDLAFVEDQFQKGQVTEYLQDMIIFDRKHTAASLILT